MIATPSQYFRALGEMKEMNQKIVKELLKQLQETQEPKDIRKLNITNIMLWMKKEAYEPTTKRAAKELKTP